MALIIYIPDSSLKNSVYRMHPSHIYIAYSQHHWPKLNLKNISPLYHQQKKLATRKHCLKNNICCYVCTNWLFKESVVHIKKYFIVDK